VAALLVLYQRDFRNGVLLMVRPDVRWEVPSRYRGYPDWKAAQPTLQPLADAAEVFLTSSGIKALYYLGDFDYDVNASLRAETDTQAELGIDYRTGKPVITEPASLEAIMRRHPTGLVVAEERRWRHPQNVPAAFSDYLEAHAERVPVPPEWRLLVFRWDRRS
jgi:hypothetical protein